MARYQNPVPQYLDGAGNPLVNGKLFFFKSGTNTQLATYKDELESIPNTHPVLLDAAARVPNIFFNGSAKVVFIADDLFTGEVGKQIFERDPVGGEKELGDFTLWDTAVTYDLNDIVEGSDGKFYISLTNANQANDPTTSADKWSEIRFIGVWNTNVTYSIGDVVQTANGDLWKALTATAGNDPSTDTGVNWLPAVDSAKILTPTNTVVYLTGGGGLINNRLNDIQDGGAYTIPLASTVSAGQYLIASQALEFASFQPTVTASGADTIAIDGGTDTDLIFDQSSSKDIRLTSDGISSWRLTI